MSLETEHLRKVFEGIYFNLWHADKPSYQEELSRQISQLIRLVPALPDKLTFVRMLYRTISEHWDTIDGYRIEKFLMLVGFIHAEVIHVIIGAAHALEVIEKFMKVIFDEILTAKSIPLGIAMHLADVHLREMHRCFQEFDAFKLKQPEIEAMIQPFLECLRNTENRQLFNRIHDKVFLELIKSNGPDATEDAELHFACFDIVPFAETTLFKAASAKDTRELNRDTLYKLYEKAAGQEEVIPEGTPYAQKMTALRNEYAVKTKHARKLLQWKKLKTEQKKKKSLLQFFQKQLNQQIADQTATQHVSQPDMPEPQPEETKVPVVSAQEVPVAPAPVQEEKVIEINQTKKKSKRKREKKAKAKFDKKSDNKRVSFGLDQNKVKEFHKAARLNTTNRMVSCERKPTTKGIIKR